MFNQSTMARIKEEEELEEMFVCIARPSWPITENIQQAAVKKEEEDVEIEPGRAKWANKLEDGDLKCELIEDLEGEEDCECAQRLQGTSVNGNGTMEQLNQNEEFPPPTVSPFGSNNGENPNKPSALPEESAETSGEQQHHCPECDKSYAFQFQLLYHQRVHTQGRRFVCTAPGCSKAFRKKGTLTHHMRLHSNTEPHRCPHCSKAFANRSNLAVHLRLHTGQLLFQCQLCSKRFNQKDQLTRHLSNTHRDSTETPNVHPEVNSSALQSLQTLPTAVLQDAEQPPASTSATSHPSTRPAPHQCPQCSKSFISPSTLLRHQRVHTHERPFVCTVPGCNMAFKQKGTLTRHLRVHSNTTTLPYKCTWPGCTKAFTTKTNQQYHLNTHAGDRPHRCPHCPSAFAQRPNLTRHLRLHTGQLPYQCGLCYKRFNQKSDLTKHMRSRKHSNHTETPNAHPVARSQVDSTALQSLETLPTAVLQDHCQRFDSYKPVEMFNPLTTVRSRDEKPKETFVCIARPDLPLCEKNVQQAVVQKEEKDCELALSLQSTSVDGIETIQLLNQNEFLPSTVPPLGSNSVEMPNGQSAVLRKSETSGGIEQPAASTSVPRPSTRHRRHQCPHCDQSFTSPSNLLTHQAVHTQERPFVCTVPGCTKAFTYKYALTRHLSIHSTSRPLKCTWPGCSKTFTSSTHQKDHLNTHTGERPHRCPHCPAAFNQRPALIRHLRLHTGQLPYQCGLCYKRFNTKQQLTSHMRSRKHRDHPQLVPNRPPADSTVPQSTATSTTAHHPPPVPLSFESADHHHLAPVQVETETEDQINKKPAAWAEDCVMYKVGETLNEEDEEEEECECSECLASLDSLHSS